MAMARVLIVDDEGAVLGFAERVLRAAGHNAIGVLTPTRALEIVSDGDPVDLVVSDVVMPLMSGPELVDEIHRISPSTRTALMSGYPASSTCPAGVPFLQKPFAPRDLVEFVARML